MTRAVDRFIEACVTGEPCKTAPEGRPRRYAAISCDGLGMLRDAWPEVMRRVMDIGTVHPAARLRFLDTWSRVPLFQIVRPLVGDDDLFIDGVRPMKVTG